MTRSTETSSPPSVAVPANPEIDRWSDLLQGHHLVVLTVLCSGVLLYSMNLFFTSAMMPTIVAEVGGQKLYAWVTTVFVMVAIAATLLVSPLMQRLGAAGTYATGFTLFGLGTAVSALSPDMGWFIFSRALQGLGGGVLVGLGYAIIRTALPQRHWARGMTAVSSMWGIGLLFGPALGGLFATFGLWRPAYGLLALAALGLAGLALRSFANLAVGGRAQPFPLRSLIVLMLAIVCIGIAGVVPVGAPMLVLLLGGLALLAGFIAIERRTRHTLLPAQTYRRGNTLKWTYLTAAALSAGVTLENFIPLYAQQMGGLHPFISGLMAASISLGWTCTQFFFSTMPPERARRAIRRGPVIMTLGLVCYGALQMADAGPPMALGWFAALVLCGSGVGMAWPSLGVVTMSSSDDADDGAKAAAALSTTQLISFSLAAALIGLLMALGGENHALAARSAIAGLAILALGGVFCARRSDTVPERG